MTTVARSPISDADIQRNVLDELEWEPSIDATHVGVIVDDGVVTLTGTVGSLGEKRRADRVTRRVFGVRALVDGLKVELPGEHERDDGDIARAAVTAFEWKASVPHERIRITVEDGVVTLSGTVDWHYQRRASEKAAAELVGVRSVRNEIVVRTPPTPVPRDVKNEIVRAFKRSALLDAQGVRVEVTGNKVRLVGRVRSWDEREEASRAAFAAPGVLVVQNDLEVTWE